MNYEERIEKALKVVSEYAYIDGADHKMWVIDQMVRALTGSDCCIDVGHECPDESDEYLEFRKSYMKIAEKTSWASPEDELARR